MVKQYGPEMGDMYYHKNVSWTDVKNKRKGAKVKEVEGGLGPKKEKEFKGVKWHYYHYSLVTKTSWLFVESTFGPLLQFSHFCVDSCYPRHTCPPPQPPPTPPTHTRTHFYLYKLWVSCVCVCIICCCFHSTTGRRDTGLSLLFELVPEEGGLKFQIGGVM